MNNGGCSQSCVNSLGGFSCACFPGYSFDLDLQICIGILVFLISKFQLL